MKNPTIVFIFILCLILKNTSAFSDEQAAYQYNQKGIECMQAGRFEEAIEALKTAHRYLPSNETVKRNLCIAYNNYGFSLMKKGDYSSAIEQYENAIYYGVDIAYTYY
ncbi:MAG TPA: hypothetical protein PKG81_02320, partial [Candidatus Omnitrophota bacterium]|nr:hypothetical protein [Candidatus Omnitrophota bacterium]